MSSLAIVRFCSEEVARQGRGPREVAGMVTAWDAALRKYRYGCGVVAKDVQLWAHLIEPEANEKGRWRDCNVRVGPHVAPHMAEVPHLMARYLDSLHTMTPEEAYKEFERVHPFRDGNGRVGKIIYNAKRGTLCNPQFPPDFFGGIANP